MQINPTRNGGRLLTGDTPHGTFRVEWDAEGNLLSEWIEIRDPSQPQPKPESPEKPAPAPKKPHGIGPGTWLYHAIQAVTFGRVRHGLQCERRRRAMDQAGWKQAPMMVIGWVWGWVVKKYRERNGVDG